MHRSFRKAFTLIELMVVIGIILLLVSIVVFGLRHVNATAARHETIAEMAVCETMLKEYQNVNGSVNIEDTFTVPKITVPLNINPATTADVQTPVYKQSATSIPGPSGSFLGVGDLSASASGDFGDRGGTQEPRYIAQCVLNTRAIMFVLLKDSKNRITLGQVPAKRILEGPPDATGAATVVPADYSMVLDGWGNPIIYVPRGGMLTWIAPSGTGAYWMVRSSGTYLSTATGGGGALPQVSTNDHPFFASAGQDGIFTDVLAKTDNGVDNIYSFQK